MPHKGTAFEKPGSVNAPFLHECRRVEADRAVSEAALWTSQEENILKKLDPLREKRKSTFDRYRNAVGQLLRMIRDGPGHGKSSCVLLRKQCRKCEGGGGDRNATHYPFCTHKGRLFKHAVEKEVFNSVRSAITSFQKADPKWNVQPTPTVHGDKTLQELNAERDIADPFVLAAGGDPQCREGPAYSKATLTATGGANAATAAVGDGREGRDKEVSAVNPLGDQGAHTLMILLCAPLP